MAGEPPKPEEWAELALLGEEEVPTPDELAEARMLAMACEGEQRVGLSSEVETGLGLLRVGTVGQLSPQAKQRIWEELPLPEAPRDQTTRGFSWLQRKWLVCAALVPAAAAALLVWQALPLRAPGFEFGTPDVPSPSADLLAAQAKWAASNDARAAFEQSMNDYRLAVLEGLE